MRYSSRFFLYAPLALLLALAGLVSLHWWRTADAFEARLAALKGHEAVPGVTLDWSSVTVSGFPFRMDATFDGFVAQGAGAHGPFAWRSEHFALHALTYGAQKTVFEAAGNQHLSWSDAAGAAHSADFLPGSLRASTVRDENGLVRFDADVVQLTAQTLSIGRAQFHMRRGEGGKTIDMMVSADEAKGDMGFAFPKSFKGMALYQTLHAAEAYGALLKGEGSPKAAHEAWHDKGGAANVTATEFNGKQNGMSIEQGMMVNALLEALY